MKSAYDVYSDFDITKHKDIFIHYLEVVIDENGVIHYAVPSHQEKSLALAREKLGMSREMIEALCPEVYYCDYITWLGLISHSVALWENFYIAAAINKPQINALRKLKRHGLYLGRVPNEPVEYPELATLLDFINLEKHLSDFANLK